MNINLTPAEYDLLLESLSAAMTAILAERDKLYDLGLHESAEMLTERYNEQNALRFKLETANGDE